MLAGCAICCGWYNTDLLVRGVYEVGFCADEFVYPVLVSFCVVLTAVASVCGLMALLFCWVFGGMAVFVSWGWVLFNVVGFDSGGGCLLWFVSLQV